MPVTGCDVTDRHEWLLLSKPSRAGGALSSTSLIRLWWLWDGAASGWSLVSGLFISALLPQALSPTCPNSPFEFFSLFPLPLFPSDQHRTVCPPLALPIHQSSSTELSHSACHSVDICACPRLIAPSDHNLTRPTHRLSPLDHSRN